MRRENPRWEYRRETSAYDKSDYRSKFYKGKWEKAWIKNRIQYALDKKIDLYESGTVRYFAIIENLANSKSEDVIIHTNKSDNIEPSRVVLLTGMKTGENANQDESINSEEIDYRDEMNIGSLGAGEVKVLSYDMSIKKLDSTNKI